MENRKYEGPMRFAHRGLVQYAPENTLGAFKAAWDKNYEGIEIDVQLSADGEIIVAHDSDFKRMTDGKVTERIEDMNAVDITSVELPFAGHVLPYDPPVPYSESEGSFRTHTPEELEKLRAEDKRTTHLITFAEFDRIFCQRPEETVVEVEVKSRGMMDRMREILATSTKTGKYILFSGNPDINEEIQVAYRNHTKPEGLRFGANIRRITEETRKFIENADLFEVGLNDFKFTADDVKLIHSLGINIFSNLGDYPEWWRAIQDGNIMGFKTNYGEAYTDWYFENIK